MMWQGAGDWRGPYDSAFSYTLRNLTPVTAEDATCNYYRRLDYNFPAICRAFSFSDGSFGVDVPGVGIIQALPRNADVRAIFAKNAQNGNGNWGFTVERIWYRLSVLEDGALEILAYVPRGWNSKP